MSAISYTSIINSFVSTEGSAGIMTNYIYYSVLVVHTDGTREVVEGRRDQISFLLAFLRTPVDEVMALRDSMGKEIQKLREDVRALRSDLNEIAEQKLTYVIDSLYPIPDLVGLNETEAIVKLGAAGLTPVLLHDYPPETPHTGVVRSCTRRQDNFLTVNLDIFHELPKVIGLKEVDAERLLTSAGFTARVSPVPVFGGEDGSVMECLRADDYSLDVELKVYKSAPDIVGMTEARAIGLLRQAGFDVQTNPVLSINGENGIVMNARFSEENPAMVRLDISKAIPNTTGLSKEEATELLQKAGFVPFTEQRIADDTEPGIVLEWYEAGENYVKLIVSQAKCITCRKAEIQCANMQGSPGDRYTATAVYNNDSKILNITVTYVINAKTRHRLMDINAETDRGEYASLQNACTMEPGVQDRFTLVVKSLKSQPPALLNGLLRTSYGLMGKEEVIHLKIALTW